jgi:outer membrane biosynthesis protein TonB
MTTPTGTPPPKVLRIGIMQGAKLIAERRMKKRETVTIGSDEKATFVVSALSKYKVHELFELAGDKYYARLADDMDARIQLSGAPGETALDLEQLQRQGKVERRKGLRSVELPVDSRGKVLIGDVTVLFQFIEAPTAVVLPAELKGGFLSSLDLQFSGILTGTSIAMLSFVMYAQSLPYVEPTTVEEISAQFQKIIMPKRDFTPPPEKKAEGEETKKKDEEKKKDDEDTKSKQKDKPDETKSKEPVDAEAAAKARREAIKKEVAGKGLLGVIGSKGRGGGALADVFSDGGFGDGKLGDAFSGIQGVDVADSAGGKGTRGGGSGGSASIGDMATSGGGSVSAGAKGEADVKGNLQTEAPEVEGELSQDVIKKEMSKNLRALKDCYERQLKRFPQLQGKIVLSFEITESGKVTGASFAEDTLKNGEVKQCILERARFWRFPKPDGGSVFVQFPLLFTPSG